MGFRLALAQCTYPEDNDTVAMARTWFAAASEQNADLLVFPEAFMGPYDEQSKRYINDPEPLEGPFAMAIDSLAAEYGIWTVYTVTEASAAGNSPFNTAIVTDSEGCKQGVYRKIHLFDAQGYRESDRLAAGDSLFMPLETPFCTLGLAICYDLRFPEVARDAALNGCQVMLFPSAWVSGHGKVRQWETLLASRAIENGMFTVGVSRADMGYIGDSCVFAPDGTLIAHGASTPWADMPKDAINVGAAALTDSDAADEAVALIYADIDLSLIDSVRKSTPALEHRRADCYR